MGHFIACFQRPSNREFSQERSRSESVDRPAEKSPVETVHEGEKSHGRYGKWEEVSPQTHHSKKRSRTYEQEILHYQDGAYDKDMDVAINEYEQTVGYQEDMEDQPSRERDRDNRSWDPSPSQEKEKKADRSPRNHNNSSRLVRSTVTAIDKDSADLRYEVGEYGEPKKEDRRSPDRHSDKSFSKESDKRCVLPVIWVFHLKQER